MLKYDCFSTLGSQTYYFAVEKEAKMRKKKAYIVVHFSLIVKNTSPREDMAVFLNFGKLKKDILDPVVAKYDNL